MFIYRYVQCLSLFLLGIIPPLLSGTALSQSNRTPDFESRLDLSTSGSDFQPPLSGALCDPEAIGHLENALAQMGGRDRWKIVQGARVTGTSIKAGTAELKSIEWLDDWSRQGRIRYSRSGKDSNGNHVRQHNGSETYSIQMQGKVHRIPEFDPPLVLLAHLPAAALVWILNDPSYCVTQEITQADKNIFRVDVTKSTNKPSQNSADEQWYFSRETGLPLEVKFRIVDAFQPSRKVWEIVVYKQFHAVNGLVVPELTSLIPPNQQTQTITFETLEINPATSPQDFGKDNVQ
jgi:hypothetical protein